MVSIFCQIKSIKNSDRFVSSGCVSHVEKVMQVVKDLVGNKLKIARSKCPTLAYINLHALNFF